MKKLWVNYWVDIGIFISFILTFFTGLVKWPGLNQIVGISHRDLPMLQISLIHDWAGLIMGLLALLHVILHWNWIVCMTKNLFKKRDNCE